MVFYPEHLPAPQIQNYANLPSQDFFVTVMDYASTRRPKYYGTFKVLATFLFTTKQDLYDFNTWFYGTANDQLARGIKPFKAKWNIEGVITEYEFAFAKDGQPQTKFLSATATEKKVILELKTDIKEIIDLNTLDGFCPDIINYQDNLINFASNHLEYFCPDIINCQDSLIDFAKNYNP